MDTFNGDSLDHSLIVLLPFLDSEDSFSDGILIFGIADDDDGTDAVVDEWYIYRTPAQKKTKGTNPFD